jgi:plastocyanin
LRRLGEEEQHDFREGREPVEIDAVEDVVAPTARSKIHNFHLASNDDPTVDFRTDLDFVGQKSFTVTFKDDNTYACEPHWQTMNGSFLVTDAPPPPPPPRRAFAHSRRPSPRQGRCG